MRLHTLLVLLVLPSALVIIYLQSRYAHRSDFGTFHPGLPEKRVQEQLQMAAARAQEQPASVGSSAAEAQPAARERELEEEEEPAHEPQPAAALASEDPAITSHPAESAAAATPAQRYEWHGVHHSGEEFNQFLPARFAAMGGIVSLTFSPVMLLQTVTPSFPMLIFFPAVLAKRAYIISCSASPAARCCRLYVISLSLFDRQIFIFRSY